MLRDLLQPDRDVVRFALTGSGVRAGTIELAAGFGLVAGALKSLRASACSAKRPRRFHPRMTLSEADSYVAACRLGQTEIGSFVLTVDTPLMFEKGRDATEVPFGRRTTTMLFDATAFIAGSIRRGESSRVLDDEQMRVSANLCEALVEMMPADESTDLRLCGRWSALLPPPPVSEVLIDRGMFEPIEQLAQQLRPKQGSELAQFVGKVIELSGSPNPADELEGDVVLHLHVDDQLVKVRVPLAPADYQQAGLAHFGQRFVSVMGRLHRGPRVNVLEQPHGFAVLPREWAQP